MWCVTFELYELVIANSRFHFQCLKALFIIVCVVMFNDDGECERSSSIMIRTEKNNATFLGNFVYTLIYYTYR